MKKLILALALLAPLTAFAAGGGAIHPNDPANIDTGNEAALQRGANYFVSYCLNCHSMQYERWQRMEEFGVPEDLLKSNLMHAGAKKGDLLKVAMAPGDAANWFGAPPPDLTLEARLRGSDWIYNYMRAFYVDESRPFGVNNTVFDNVGMPHVLWEQQGMQKAVYTEEDDGHGGTHKVFAGFEKVSEGSMTDVEYDAMIRDLVTFMTYMAEPTKAKSHRTGIMVLLFLALLLVFSYMLKKEYWKDVH
ncbi:cytochrome c1 [Solemya velum gill symbiont]|uniref:Cytochrome c1 n=1 Tax=Solemya velum gill symbiont TaxID=2340 RepID=A0A1T2I9V5_SOVGS|nr:cytochrome c1 [Solemya velum gill symbiont]OOY36193.1 cytochrome c1 [Solemya velum gill symbiont]OOY39591.1 cytochrome c1 [Solemya velum gill symbiont]OOY41624.1 cytochrome c1 [Solemya velum gill symbiont]OOY46793.1 cytochrome c1 [Solemya velum gill symbiont]OOY47982.1 cytochrome c1 [Solemya velum gill symbiont]